MYDINSKKYKKIITDNGGELSFVRANDDFSEIWYGWYNNSFSLYRYTVNTGIDELMVWGRSFQKEYEGRRIYYVEVEEESEKSLWDFVEDDTESGGEVDSERRRRNKLKNKLMDEKVYKWSLCYFDGEKTHKIVSSYDWTWYSNIEPGIFAGKEPVAIVKIREWDNNKLVKFSEINTIDEVRNAFDEQYYIISEDKIQGNLFDTTPKGVSLLHISTDGKNMVYEVRDEDKDDAGIYLMSNINQTNKSVVSLGNGRDIDYMWDNLSTGGFLYAWYDNGEYSIGKYRNGQMQIIYPEVKWGNIYELESQGDILVVSGGNLIRCGNEPDLIDYGVYALSN